MIGKLLSIAAVLCGLVAATCATAGELNIHKNVAYFSGPITLDDLIAIGKLPPEVDLLVLNSTGGNTGGIIHLMGELRKRGITTFVDEGLRCQSACAMLFSAGKRRIVHPKARLMFHAPLMDVNDKISVKVLGELNQARTKLMIDFGLDPDFVKFTQNGPQHTSEREIDATQALQLRVATETGVLGVVLGLF